MDGSAEQRSRVAAEVNFDGALWVSGYDSFKTLRESLCMSSSSGNLDAVASLPCSVLVVELVAALLRVRVAARPATPLRAAVPVVAAPPSAAGTAVGTPSTALPRVGRVVLPWPTCPVCAVLHVASQARMSAGGVAGKTCVVTHSCDARGGRAAVRGIIAAPTGPDLRTVDGAVLTDPPVGNVVILLGRPAIDAGRTASVTGELPTGRAG